jgi:hypothetical protein
MTPADALAIDVNVAHLFGVGTEVSTAGFRKAASQ